MIHNLGHCDRSAVCSLTQFSLSNVADLGWQQRSKEWGQGSGESAKISNAFD
jgi:hypothetical protein